MRGGRYHPEAVGARPLESEQGGQESYGGRGGGRRGRGRGRGYGQADGGWDGNDGQRRGRGGSNRGRGGRGEWGAQNNRGRGDNSAQRGRADADGAGWQGNDSAGASEYRRPPIVVGERVQFDGPGTGMARGAVDARGPESPAVRAPRVGEVANVGGYAPMGQAQAGMGSVGGYTGAAAGMRGAPMAAPAVSAALSAADALARLDPAVIQAVVAGRLAGTTAPQAVGQSASSQVAAEPGILGQRGPADLAMDSRNAQDSAPALTQLDNMNPRDPSCRVVYVFDWRVPNFDRIPTSWLSSPVFWFEKKPWRLDIQPRQQMGVLRLFLSALVGEENCDLTPIDIKVKVSAVSQDGSRPSLSQEILQTVQQSKPHTGWDHFAPLEVLYQGYLRDHALLLRVELEVVSAMSLAVPDAAQWPSGSVQASAGPEPGTFVLRGSYSPQLLYAAARNDVAGIKRELTVPGVAVDGADPDGNTALMVACQAHAAAAAKALVGAGASAAARNAAGLSPLHAAMTSKTDGAGLADPDADLIDTVAMAKADLNEHFVGGIFNGMTPLGVAAALGLSRVAEVLLMRGADALVQTKDPKFKLEPLFIAVLENHLSVVDVLLRLRPATGLDLRHTITPYGRVTPLSLALAMGNATIAKALLKAGARMGPEDRSIAIPAAVAGAMWDAAIRAPDETAAAAAVALLAAGLDVECRDGETGKRPLHLAAEGGLPGVAQVLLLRANARPNVQDNKGLTPLILACTRGSEVAWQDVLKELLRHPKIDVCLGASPDLYPLVALIRSRAPIAAVVDLLEHGAHRDINRTSKHVALHEAVCIGSMELVELLVLRYRANVNARADMDRGTLGAHWPAQMVPPSVMLLRGATPLHVAALRGDMGAIRFLLDNGADPGIRTEAPHARYKYLPFDFARANPGAARLLEPPNRGRGPMDSRAGPGGRGRGRGRGEGGRGGQDGRRRGSAGSRGSPPQGRKRGPAGQEEEGWGAREKRARREEGGDGERGGERREGAEEGGVDAGAGAGAADMGAGGQQDVQQDVHVEMHSEGTEQSGGWDGGASGGGDGQGDMGGGYDGGDDGGNEGGGGGGGGGGGRDEEEEALDFGTEEVDGMAEQ